MHGRQLRLLVPPDVVATTVDALCNPSAKNANKCPARLFNSQLADGIHFLRLPNVALIQSGDWSADEDQRRMVVAPGLTSSRSAKRRIVMAWIVTLIGFVAV